MKKIMFKDKYGLTEAVLEGRKTTTRRIVPDGTPLGNWEETEKISRFKIGEVVAVAQAYKHVFDEMMRGDYGDDRYDAFKNHYFGSGEGWHNKMFVESEYMPHQIRITNIHVERLQDISDEDCIREGIVKALGLYGCEGLCERGDQLYFNTPRTAFAALIDRISGKGTWEKNPWVFVYEFELLA